MKTLHKVTDCIPCGIRSHGVLQRYADKINLVFAASRSPHSAINLSKIVFEWQQESTNETMDSSSTLMGSKVLEVICYLLVISPY